MEAVQAAMYECLACGNDRQYGSAGKPQYPAIQPKLTCGCQPGLIPHKFLRVDVKPWVNYVPTKHFISWRQMFSVV